MIVQWMGVDEGGHDYEASMRMIIDALQKPLSSPVFASASHLLVRYAFEKEGIDLALMTPEGWGATLWLTGEYVEDVDPALAADVIMREFRSVYQNRIEYPPEE